MAFSGKTEFLHVVSRAFRRTFVRSSSNGAGSCKGNFMCSAPKVRLHVQAQRRLKDVTVDTIEIGAMLSTSAIAFVFYFWTRLRVGTTAPFIF